VLISQTNRAVISLFSSFGKHRNRTERTEIEFGRFRVFLRTDRYQISEEPNSPRYRGTKLIGSGIPNAQDDFWLCSLVLEPKIINATLSLSPITKLLFSFSFSQFLLLVQIPTTVMHSVPAAASPVSRPYAGLQARASSPAQRTASGAASLGISPASARWSAA
jgi:hypothetical protein